MRIRFRFAKLGKVRFTSQRDTARMWERALRRGGLPLAYTEGFSPRPRISFGLALPTGCESRAEYLDVALDEDRIGPDGLDVAALPDRLTPLLPEGIEVEEAATVSRAEGSLQQVVTSCSWTLRVAGVDRTGLGALVAALLDATEVPIARERKGREERDDLRPSVLTLAVAAAADDEAADPIGRTLGLVAELATQPRGVRPVELVRGLAVGADPGHLPVLDRACRTEQWIERDGLREEPLRRTAVPADAWRAPHALERAS